MDNEMNFFDRFLYKLFISFFLLFIIVILNKYEVVDITKLKVSIDDNINVLNVITKINGNTNFIDLGTGDEITVSNKTYDFEMIDDNIMRIKCDDYSGVQSHIAGVVVKIAKEADKYEISIKGIDDHIYIYSNLDSIDCHIYDYLRTDDFLGSCNDYYDLKIE